MTGLSTPPAPLRDIPQPRLCAGLKPGRASNGSLPRVSKLLKSQRTSAPAERPSGATAATPDTMKAHDSTGGCSLARLVRRFSVMLSPPRPQHSDSAATSQTCLLRNIRHEAAASAVPVSHRRKLQTSPAMAVHSWRKLSDTAERPSGATAATPDTMKAHDSTGGCSLARLVRRFWCRIVGHKWDEDAITYGCMAYCLRCHYEQECGPSEPWTLANWLWWRKQKLSSWYWRLRGRIRQWRNQPPDDIPFSSPNARGERPPPTGKVERTRHSRIAAQL